MNPCTQKHTPTQNPKTLQRDLSLIFRLFGNCLDQFGASSKLCWSHLHPQDVSLGTSVQPMWGPEWLPRPEHLVTVVTNYYALFAIFLKHDFTSRWSSLKTDIFQKPILAYRHGLNDLQCLWVRWTICIDNWATCCGLRHLQYWQKAVACRMPEGHRRLPTTASLRALVRELAVLWWLSCVKETQAKKRNMLIVPSTTSRNYIDINWWEGHIHNLQRHRLPQTCPESSGAWLNTSRAEVFHSILSNYNMRFTSIKIPAFQSHTSTCCSF